MTAVFGTPIASILLAVELLLFEWKPRSFLPVAIASIVAAALRPLMMGGTPIFPYIGGVTISSWHVAAWALMGVLAGAGSRSEEHTSELQSLMRISYAVFCLKKKK